MRKSAVVTFLVGLAAGYGLHSLFSAQDDSRLVSSNQPSASTCETQESRNPRRPSPRIAETRELERRTEAAAEVNRPQPRIYRMPKYSAQWKNQEQEEEPTSGLSLSEEIISELERQGAGLRDHAFAVRESDGWRIQLLEGERTFGSSGLRSGDIITFDSLNSQLANPANSSLAKRFIAVLYQIEQEGG